MAGDIKARLSSPKLRIRAEKRAQGFIHGNKGNTLSESPENMFPFETLFGVDSDSVTKWYTLRKNAENSGRINEN